MEACETSRASFAGLNILSRIMKQKAIFEENHIKICLARKELLSRFLATMWVPGTFLHAGQFFVLHRFKCGLIFPSLLSMLTVYQKWFILNTLLNSFPKQTAINV